MAPKLTPSTEKKPAERRPVESKRNGAVIKKASKAAKKQRRKEREKIRQKYGEDAAPKQQPKTIENMREADVTYVDVNDEEVKHDEQNDELAAYFNRETQPKILLTTSPKAKVVALKFAFELHKCIPDSEFLPRKNASIKKIVKDAISRDYTDIVVVHEDNKKPNGLIVCHLPEGPTAYFKINSLKFSKDIKGVGDSTDHCPEVILNNFNTRLGHTVARMFACLFPHDPEFHGRRVVTFHNQRDYIFFRHHRYEFKREGEKAALHELGPRFTLRLKWLQNGTFDTREGEFEWVNKRHEMEASKRRFYL
ncbi:Brix domain containing protein [Aphelenchoides besseyi]|nr:Brix domain containing protein [Aphelenchoides besseyi]